MAKQTQTIRRQEPTNCLSLFDHFVGLALKRIINPKILKFVGSTKPQSLRILRKKIIFDSNKTSLISRDTRKESQNPSVNKTYSVGFNHDTKLLWKYEIKKIKSSCWYLVYKKHKIWLAKEPLWPKHKNKSDELLEMPAHMQNISIIAQFIAQIAQSTTCLYIFLTICKKFKFIPKFIFQIQRTRCFQSFWVCLTTHTWNG